jgi:hypothetical protein
MRTLDDFLINLINLFNFSIHCAGLPIQQGECSKFFGSAYLLAIFICLLVVYYAVRHILRDRSEFNAYEKRMAARAAIASSEEMNKVKWLSEDEHSDIDEVELATKMRQQLNLTKRS